MAADLGAVPPLLWALPAATLLLVENGEVERALEVYSTASRYPFVAQSRWFEEAVGHRIAAAAAMVPAIESADLEARGRTRDLKTTTAELLAELRG